MTLIPRGARVLSALGNQFERVDLGAFAVDGAVCGRRKRWIAPRIAGRCAIKRRNAGRGIELRQPVERLVEISVLLPIEPQFSEVMIEGSVLLNDKDDVVNFLQPQQ